MKRSLHILPAVAPEVPHAKWDLLLKECRKLLRDGVVVALSGGVDSSLLLAAFATAQDVTMKHQLSALLVTGPAVPDADVRDARHVAKLFGVPLRELAGAEGQDEYYLRNAPDRCYYCKRELFRLASLVQERDGARNVAYGYNASDAGDDRPGQRAAIESGARWPLAEVGLSKPDIRRLLLWLNLDIAGKEASPCFASRIEHGVRVTPERLRHVSELEAQLRELGVTRVRARICSSTLGDLVRIECNEAEMSVVLGSRAEIVTRARSLGYRTAVLDLAGYRTGGAAASDAQSQGTSGVK